MTALLRLLLLTITLPLATATLAAPSADLWPRWSEHDPASEATIDHGAWTRWLERFRQVDQAGVARVDYAAAKRAGRSALGDYIDRLAAVAISDYNRDQQFAYWINLYNALTVDVVLEHYPVASIRDIDISPGLFSDGPWGAELVAVEGVALTLDDIEHRILRPIWEDPRIHYAVNCASVGCPDLRGRAFTAAQADAMLTAGARDYINDPRGAAVVEGELVVSSIYEWFQADFGGTEQGVIDHLRRYAEPGLGERLAGRTGYDDDRYDWSLNDVR